MWTILKLFGIAACFYAGLTAWIFFSQHRLLYRATQTLVASPADRGLCHEDIWLKNSFGTRLHSWWLPVKNPRYVVLFSHGNGGNVSHRLETLSLFNTMGFSTLIYEYSGYGQSQGQSSEKAMRADARAAWEWLVREKGVPPERIILFGRSLGGGVTGLLARDLADQGVSPAALIMESTFSSMTDMATRKYPWLPVRWLVRYRYDTMVNLAAVHVPALFLHSPDDDIVPYAFGVRLFQSYSGPKTFFELSGEHTTGFLSMGSKYVDGLESFVSSLP